MFGSLGSSDGIAISGPGADKFRIVVYLLRLTLHPLSPRSKLLRSDPSDSGRLFVGRRPG
jgi:hypothetical protein